MYELESQDSSSTTRADDGSDNKPYIAPTTTYSSFYSQHQQWPLGTRTTEKSSSSTSQERNCSIISTPNANDIQTTKGFMNIIGHRSPCEEGNYLQHHQSYESSLFFYPSSDQQLEHRCNSLSTVSSDANLSSQRTDTLSPPYSIHPQQPTNCVQPSYASIDANSSPNNHHPHQQCTMIDDNSPNSPTPSSVKHSESSGKQKMELKSSQSENNSDERRRATTRRKLSYCASFFAKFITVTNVLVVLFIFQVFLGIASSFVLLYSSGEHVLSHIRDFQRFQMQVFIDGEIQHFMDNINTMVSHMMRLVHRINLNDEIALLKIIDTIDTLYASTVGANAYRYARFDDRYLAREYNQTVKGLALRVYDPLETSFRYFKISKEDMILAPNNCSLSEYLNSTFTPFFKSKDARYNPKSRVYYLPFDRGNDSATDILWTESWINYVGASVVSLSIPLFSNYSLSYLNDPRNNDLIQSAFSPKLISIPSVNSYSNPQYKKPEYLFGVLSIQFSIELTISKLLNSTRSGWDILSSYNNNILDNSFIMDAKNTILGQHGAGTRVNAMYNIIVQKQLIEVLLAAKCSAIQLPSNRTDASVTSSNTLFFIIPGGTTVNGTTIPDTLEVAIMPFCDKYNLQWFIVVGIKQTSFLEEAIGGSVYNIAIFVGVLALEMLLLSLIIIRISFSLQQIASSMAKISQFGSVFENSKNTMSKWKQRLLKTINFLQRNTLFYDIRLMHQNLSIMNNGLASFYKYIPMTIMKHNICEGENFAVGFSKRELGILRVEINGFSKLSLSTANCESFTRVMAKYYNLSFIAIQDNGGMVDQIVGGIVTAVFHLPDHASENCETQMCRSALQIILELEKLNQNLSTNFTVTISMNYGNMSVGNIGSNVRLSFSVFGPEVTLIRNMISELQNFSKSQILITERVYDKVKHIFTCYFIDFVIVNEQVKGIYTLECLSELSSVNQKEISSTLANIRQCIIEHRCFKEAKIELTKLLSDTQSPCPHTLLQTLNDKIAVHNKN
ncbi:hypothetical protein C9374_009204 [Naegleria lovaniensis]|uniref:Guanylate cyclase domain-containing protein n=1 Tax=Naegleria lovaniensis TaxID=51637 RepID=A0AA88GFQ0_NAELO|nr:uncharacterized protein C9374_009204 [Naegleria lovaniensis]KAG2377688.1 hypothetical protein C9374_009204 [Naegleria lovaniensis]